VAAEGTARVGDGRLWAARLGGGRYGDGRLRGGRVIQNSDSRLGSGRKNGNGRLGGGYGEGRLGGSRYSNGGCLGAAGAAVAGWVTAGTAIEGRREVEATCLKRALEVMKSTRGDGKGSRGRARWMGESVVARKAWSREGAGWRVGWCREG
jgi:hypothetical protein